MTMAKRKNKKGRISRTAKDVEAPELQQASKVGVSRGHVAFSNGTTNGAFEFYFRPYHSSPALWKAPTTSLVAESGYREDGAFLVVTGPAAIRDLVKRLTGRCPSDIGIRFSDDRPDEEDQVPVDGPTNPSGLPARPRTPRIAPEGPSKGREGSGAVGIVAAFLSEAGRGLEIGPLHAELVSRGLIRGSMAASKWNLYRALRGALLRLGEACPVERIGDVYQARG